MRSLDRYKKMMTQRILAKPTITQQRLSLNMPEVDELFPGFSLGDFAILQGSPSVISLTSLLCVRAQLPTQVGGLASSVVFIDGGNKFRLYKIARIAQLHQMDSRQVLEHIYISRAFTAYQLTSLLMEKLEETVKKYNAKVVVISDIAGFFLDEDVDNEEACSIYNQMLSYLSSFARKNKIIIVATYLPYHNSKRNSALKEISCSKANVVLSLSKTLYTSEVVLEKHPSYVLGTADFPSENVTLMDFMGTQ